jgi:squalene-hopene/tetraprenyl-beta-curcumene cyclase
VIVPLLVLQAKKPLASNPRGVRVDELYDPSSNVRAGSKAAHIDPLWTWFFSVLDGVLKAGDGLWPSGLRQKALQRCVDFVVERLNGEDGLGAIYPAMANAVMMFAALGYSEDHPHRATARRAVEKLLVFKEEEVYCQPCVSPVWDTALACHALMETGTRQAEAAALRGLEWLKPRQVLDVAGDWAQTRPHVRPGGWAFQYNNAHYPDLDDTAVVVMAMDRARQRGARGFGVAIARGAEWVSGLQSRNGGWGAFDVDNCYDYLNNIPFADHGALLDPPTADVSARCVSMFAQLGAQPEHPLMQKALAYLEAQQERDGSWFGRWGVNYIYGAWSVLCALNAAGVDPRSPTVRRTVYWLVGIQNADGGWGESCDSYELAYPGYQPAESRASQTAWALLGLMAAGEAAHPAVARGVEYLCTNQDADGFWSEPHYTGGGFPRVFYLRYHGYSKFFPLWALARYQNLMRANERQVGYGM